MEAAPFVLSTVLALAVGLGRVRVPPRTLLVADCVLRSLTFTALGVLAVTGRLTLPVPLRRDGQAGRVEQPPPAGDGSRGRVVATAGAGYALFFDAGGALVLLAATSVFVPARPRDPTPCASRRRPAGGSCAAARWPLGGPLIELAGSTGGLVLSGVLTLLLLPIAAWAVLGRIEEREPTCA